MGSGRRRTAWRCCSSPTWPASTRTSSPRIGRCCARWWRDGPCEERSFFAHYPNTVRTNPEGDPCMTTRHRDSLAWLALGAVLLFAAQTRGGIGMLAWIAPLPWLVVLRTTTGWRWRAALAGALALGWVAAT